MTSMLIENIHIMLKSVETSLQWTLSPFLPRLRKWQLGFPSLGLSQPFSAQPLYCPQPGAHIGCIVDYPFLTWTFDTGKPRVLSFVRRMLAYK